MLNAEIDIAYELLRSPDFASALPAVLARVAQAFQVSEVRLFALEDATGNDRDSCLVLAGQWPASGSERSSDASGETRYCESDFPELFDELRGGRSVIMRDIAPGNTRYDDSGPQGAEDSDQRISLVPVLFHRKLVAVLCLHVPMARNHFSVEELKVLERLTRIIGAALTRPAGVDDSRKGPEDQLMARLQQLESRERELLDNLQRLTGQCDLQTFLAGCVLSTALRQLDSTGGSVIVLNAKRQVWHVTAHVYEDGRDATPYPDQVEADPFTRVCEAAGGVLQPMLFELDGEVPIDWPGMIEYHFARGDTCLLLVPLVFGNRLVGVVLLAFNQRRDISEFLSSQILTGLIRGATIAIELSRLAEEACQAAVLNERNRIAQELHDGLAQAFTGILMQVNATDIESAEMPSQVVKVLGRIRELARDGLAEARRSVNTLRPNQARRFGLAKLLERLAEGYSIAGKIQCRFHRSDEEFPFSPEHEHELLRIAQEAVSNAVRHGMPANVLIDLCRRDGIWMLSISDDGRGMPSTFRDCARQGFGLNSMHERAKAIGGDLMINSRPGEGTQVIVCLPERSAS